MLPLAKELLEFSKFSIKFAKENVFPKYLDAIKTIGVIKVGYLGTVTDDGALDFYDGKLRLMKPDGSYDDFAYDQYVDYIGEWVEPWSYQKFPYAKKWGKLEHGPGQPHGRLPHQLPGPHQRGRQDGHAPGPEGTGGVPDVPSAGRPTSPCCTITPASSNSCSAPSTRWSS